MIVTKYDDRLTIVLEGESTIEDIIQSDDLFMNDLSFSVGCDLMLLDHNRQDTLLIRSYFAGWEHVTELNELLSGEELILYYRYELSEYDELSKEA